HAKPAASSTSSSRQCLADHGIRSGAHFHLTVRLQQVTGQRSTRQPSINTAHQKHHRPIGRGSPLRSGSSKRQGIPSIQLQIEFGQQQSIRASQIQSDGQHESAQASSHRQQSIR
ncbi:hypothetical protein ACLOJK_014965, partial [Asimina triloba]